MTNVSQEAFTGLSGRWVAYDPEPSRPVSELLPSVKNMVEYNLAQLQDEESNFGGGGQTLGAAGFVVYNGLSYSCTNVRGYAHARSGRFAAFSRYYETGFDDDAPRDDPAYIPIAINTGLCIPGDGSAVAGRIFGLLTPEGHTFNNEALNAMVGALALYNYQSHQRLILPAEQ